MPLPDEITWTCHVCGDTRPDRLIGVHHHPRTLPGGITMTENVRYCLDRELCASGALDFHFIPLKPGEG